MKTRIEITICDDDTIDVCLENPSGTHMLTIIGILEKIKTEFILTTPKPESKEQNNDNTLHTT